MSAKWYIVHVYSGFERKVAEAIREVAERNGVSDKIEEVLIPTQTVSEIRRGKKVQAEQKFFPGYVLIKMILTDDTWHLVKNLPKVTGFLGETPSKPTPVPDSQITKIMQQMEKITTVSIIKGFEVGDNVRVIDGPFLSFNGSVEEVDDERQRLKVSISIFGRSTPVELNYMQVEKVS